MTAASCFYGFKFLEQDITLLLPLLAGFLLIVIANAVHGGNKGLFYFSCVLVLFNIFYIPLMSIPKSLLRQPELKWILALVLITNLVAAIRYGYFLIKGK